MIDVARVQRLGLPPCRLYKNLKAGDDILLANGTLIRFVRRCRRVRFSDTRTLCRHSKFARRHRRVDARSARLFAGACLNPSLRFDTISLTPLPRATRLMRAASPRSRTASTCSSTVRRSSAHPLCLSPHDRRRRFDQTARCRRASRVWRASSRTRARRSPRASPSSSKPRI